LCTIAKLVNGMALHSSNGDGVMSQHGRVDRRARILDIKMICSPGMAFIDGRCRKLL
jgi:hypothetical protein